MTPASPSAAPMDHTRAPSEPTGVEPSFEDQMTSARGAGAGRFFSLDAKRDLQSRLLVVQERVDWSPEVKRDRIREAIARAVSLGFQIDRELRSAVKSSGLSEESSARRIKALLDCGALPNAVDSSGRSSLHWAVAVNAPTEVFEDLLKAGASWDQKSAPGGKSPMNYMDSTLGANGLPLAQRSALEKIIASEPARLETPPARKLSL